MMRFFLAVSTALLQLCTQKKLYLLTLQNIRNVPDQSNYVQVYSICIYIYIYIVNKYRASMAFGTRFFFLISLVSRNYLSTFSKKNMNRKILLLGKERDAHFDFPFISCRIADGGLTLPRRKKAVQYYVGTRVMKVLKNLEYHYWHSLKSKLD